MVLLPRADVAHRLPGFGVVDGYVRWRPQFDAVARLQGCDNDVFVAPRRCTCLHCRVQILPDGMCVGRICPDGRDQGVLVGGLHRVSRLRDAGCCGSKEDRRPRVYSEVERDVDDDDSDLPEASDDDSVARIAGQRAGH